MVLDSFLPKSHTRKNQTRYGSGVYHSTDNANFQGTEFLSVKSASGPIKYGVFQEEIPWLSDAVQFYTDVQALCANNCSGVCGICMLRYKVDLKIEQLLKICEVNNPRLSQKDDRFFRNFNVKKQESLLVHRRFGSIGKKKNSEVLRVLVVKNLIS